MSRLIYIYIYVYINDSSTNVIGNPQYSRDNWAYPYGKSLYKTYIVCMKMGYNPQESLKNTINTMGTLPGVQPTFALWTYTPSCTIIQYADSGCSPQKIPFNLKNVCSKLPAQLINFKSHNPSSVPVFRPSKYPPGVSLFGEILNQSQPK